MKLREEIGTLSHTAAVVVSWGIHQTHAAAARSWWVGLPGDLGTDARTGGKRFLPPRRRPWTVLQPAVWQKDLEAPLQNSRSHWQLVPASDQTAKC